MGLNRDSICRNELGKVFEEFRFVFCVEYKVIIPLLYWVLHALKALQYLRLEVGCGDFHAV